jgi:hypothetical protein
MKVDVKERDSKKKKKKKDKSKKSKKDLETEEMLSDVDE